MGIFSEIDMENRIKKEQAEEQAMTASELAAQRDEAHHQHHRQRDPQKDATNVRRCLRALHKRGLNRCHVFVTPLVCIYAPGVMKSNSVGVFTSLSAHCR